MARTTVTLHSRFPAIIAKLPASVDAAIGIGAERIAGAARDRVPVQTGKLREAIHTEREDGGHAVYAGDHDAFYGHLVEYGTSDTGARPFLIPAYETHKAEVIALAREALDRL